MYVYTYECNGSLFEADNESSLLSGPNISLHAIRSQYFHDTAIRSQSSQQVISGSFFVSFFVIKPERFVEKIFVLAVHDGLVLSFVYLGLRATRGLLFWLGFIYFYSLFILFLLFTIIIIEFFYEWNKNKMIIMSFYLFILERVIRRTIYLINKCL